MPDREKVIKELESLRDICNAKSNMAVGNGKIAWAGYANTADDALALLKEQPEVVKCWQCRRNNECSIQFKFAPADNPGDWFCAYGERSNKLAEEDWITSTDALKNMWVTLETESLTALSKIWLICSMNVNGSFPETHVRANGWKPETPSRRSGSRMPDGRNGSKSIWQTSEQRYCSRSV